MEVLMVTGRRLAWTSGCVGVAAGCMGTWFEASHGVFCIPVMTLPPVILSHQVAAGSTVFGVAARQLLSVGLFAADPSDPFDPDHIDELIDTNAALALAASGTVGALAASALCARFSSTRVKRFNGVFMIGCAVFMQWREKLVREYGSRPDDDLEELSEEMSTIVVKPDGTVKQQPAGIAGPQPFAGPTLGPGGQRRSEADVPRLHIENPCTPVRELPRFVALGTLSGAVLGFFGVGPAWMLAPLVMRTSPEWAQIEAAAEGRQDQKPESSFRQFMPLPMSWTSRQTETSEVSSSASGAVEGPDVGRIDFIGPTGSDERTRRTCSLAMLPPCLAAAWRHWSFGHVTDAGNVALPLAVGAVIGSIGAGKLLDDVPCDEQTRFGLSMVLFMYGAWNLLGPR
eukprot:TRINITY_DN36491_c0_g1_i1.p1 TRINITY_DN36491_c0_g1~~TRINITY_DN36491_c0_g1_i1.p1  ORF type:complete len:399 (-),score=72.77 TRINITY_DN36491_c0_g1_i1:72-1268(-)